MMHPGGQLSETSSSDVYVENRYLYSKNSRSIGVLWAVFSLCFAIINAVVFVQPQWLGDTATSRGTGYFGLWRSCRLLQDGQDLICEGRLDDFGSIQTPAFRAATVFVGLSVCLSALCVVTMVLFFFLHSSTVFHVCGWMQLSCAMCMMVGVLVFPIGWDTPMVREVCGNDSDSYSPGQCGIRWAFILALIGVIDCVVLSILAFVLGTRYVKMLPDHYLPNGTKYKGEVNSAFTPQEYYSNKKLIGSMQQHPQQQHPQHHHAISSLPIKQHSQQHLHLNTAGGATYLPPSFAHHQAHLGHHHSHQHHPQIRQTPPPPPPPLSLPPLGGSPNQHPQQQPDSERFSDYSQRTSGSSYKSSSRLGGSRLHVQQTAPLSQHSHNTNTTGTTNSPSYGQF